VNAADELTHLHNLQARVRRQFRAKYCLHPEAPAGCSAKIAAAHTVQRAILAKHIASRGHVMQFKMEPMSQPLGLFVSPKKIGLNEATTFFGFCDKHDRQMFRLLETVPFRFDPHQIALLGYRAICREKYQKEAEIAAADAMYDYVSVVPDIPDFERKKQVHHMQRLARLNARRNIERTRIEHAQLLKPEYHRSLRYFAIRFDSAPVYFASTAFLPEWDFHGRRLQNLSGLEDYVILTFSAWAAERQAAAVFCWHESADKVCVPFIDSLRSSPSNRLGDRVLSMAFEYSENVVFSRKWWKSVAEVDRQKLANRVASGSGVLGPDRNERSLLDDGLSALTSEVVSTCQSY
jgi:hypothetical protein